MLIFKIYTLRMRLHLVNTFVNHGSVFIQTRVDFLPRKYDVIFQLRHSYAKGPFLRGADQLYFPFFSFIMFPFQNKVFDLFLHHFFRILDNINEFYVIKTLNVMLCKEHVPYLRHFNSTKFTFRFPMYNSNCFSSSLQKHIL